MKDDDIPAHVDVDGEAKYRVKLPVKNNITLETQVFGQENNIQKDLIALEPSGHYMYRTVVTICTASLTFNNSTFCPHSVFMCFVWI